MGEAAALIYFTVIPVEESAPAQALLKPVSGHVPGLCQARASVGMRGGLVSGGLPAGFVAFCHPLPGLVSRPWLRVHLSGLTQCQLWNAPNTCSGHGGGTVGLEESCRVVGL